MAKFVLVYSKNCVKRYRYCDTQKKYRTVANSLKLGTFILVILQNCVKRVPVL
jgi:hypothetical protein